MFIKNLKANVTGIASREFVQFFFFFYFFVSVLQHHVDEIDRPSKSFEERRFGFEDVRALEGDDDPGRDESEGKGDRDVMWEGSVCTWVDLADIHTEHSLST